MFKNVFSFNGRITRTEYGFSWIIAFSLDVILDLLVLSYSEWKYILIVFYLPVYWFIIAQTAKRCHDIGRSGWFQLIPLYDIYLLFAKPQEGVNKYGHPKEMEPGDFGDGIDGPGE